MGFAPALSTMAGLDVVSVSRWTKWRPQTFGSITGVYRDGPRSYEYLRAMSSYGLEGPANAWRGPPTTGGGHQRLEGATNDWRGQPTTGGTYQRLEGPTNDCRGPPTTGGGHQRLEGPTNDWRDLPTTGGAHQRLEGPTNVWRGPPKTWTFGWVQEHKH